MQRAAEAGYSEACFCLRRTVCEESASHWMWRGRALAGGYNEKWRDYFEAMTRFFDSFVKLPEAAGACLFEFGRVLQGQISENGFEKKIFGERRSHDVVDCAKKICELYRYWVAVFRTSLNTWSLVAVRVGMAKDLRIVIAKLIWRDRVEFCRTLCKKGLHNL